jgi:acyl carrier protein
MLNKIIKFKIMKIEFTEFKEAFMEAFELDESFEVKMDDEFREYDNWDSLTKLSLIAVLDDEFDVLIEDKDFSKIITIQDLYDFLIKIKS